MTPKTENHKAKNKSGVRGSTRWPGIKSLAAQLGRNIDYVRTVLDGQRRSPRLIALIREQRAHPIAKLISDKTYE